MLRSRTIARTQGAVSLETLWAIIREYEASYLFLCRDAQRRVDELCATLYNCHADRNHVWSLAAPHPAESLVTEQRKKQIDDLSYKIDKLNTKVARAFGFVVAMHFTLFQYTVRRKELETQMKAKYNKNREGGEKLREEELVAESRFVGRAEYILHDFRDGPYGAFKLDWELDVTSRVQTRLKESCLSWVFN
jgi:hypothetical protein